MSDIMRIQSKIDSKFFKLKGKSVIGFYVAAEDSGVGRKISRWNHQGCAKIANTNWMMLIEKWTRRMSGNEAPIRTIPARDVTEGIQGDYEKNRGMRREDEWMKTHELGNEPELELPFEVPEEFLDYDEEDEMMFSKKAMLRQLAGIGEAD